MVPLLISLQRQIYHQLISKNFLWIIEGCTIFLNCHFFYTKGLLLCYHIQRKQFMLVFFNKLHHNIYVEEGYPYDLRAIKFDFRLWYFKWKCKFTAVSAAWWNVKLLQWKMVFKSPFWIQKLWKAEILTEYSYELVF